MRWQLKWARNAVFGVLPFSGSFRRLKRRLRPYPTDVPPWTLEEGLRLVELVRESGSSLTGAQVLEVGSGWRPIVPLLFVLAGAARVVMVDTQRLMDAATFTGTVENLKRQASLLADRLGVEERTIREFLTSPPADLTEALARAFGWSTTRPAT